MQQWQEFPGSGFSSCLCGLFNKKGLLRDAREGHIALYHLHIILLVIGGKNAAHAYDSSSFK